MKVSKSAAYKMAFNARAGTYTLMMFLAMMGVDQIAQSNDNGTQHVDDKQDTVWFVVGDKSFDHGMMSANIPLHQRDAVFSCFVDIKYFMI